MEQLTGPVAVVGAGVMGRGIAYVAAIAAARAGTNVRLVDVAADQLDTAIARVHADLDAGVERGKVEAADAAGARGCLATTTDLAAGCAGAHLVVEAVVERMDVKHDVLRRAEGVADPDAVLASNTSAMSLTEIAGGLDEPARGVGMHFFNPVPKMRLVELVSGLQTAPSTLDRAEAFARAMGKTTVRVNDLPGFATSRLNALIGNEGMRMLEERVAAPEDIDTAVTLGLNHPMGPLAMGDLVGWDTRLDILEYLAGTLGDRFRPTNLQRRLVAAGRTGRKSGRGVYRYAEDGTRLDEPSDLGRDAV